MLYSTGFGAPGKVLVMPFMTKAYCAAIGFLWGLRCWKLRPPVQGRAGRRKRALVLVARWGDQAPIAIGRGACHPARQRYESLGQSDGRRRDPLRRQGDP